MTLHVGKIVINGRRVGKTTLVCEQLKHILEGSGNIWDESKDPVSDMIDSAKKLVFEARNNIITPVLMSKTEFKLLSRDLESDVECTEQFEPVPKKGFARFRDIAERKNKKRSWRK